jgi:hypothetical protein
LPLCPKFKIMQSWCVNIMALYKQKYSMNNLKVSQKLKYFTKNNQNLSKIT